MIFKVTLINMLNETNVVLLESPVQLDSSETTRIEALRAANKLDTNAFFDTRISEIVEWKRE